MMRIPTLLRLVASLAPVAIAVAACDSNSPATGALTISTTTKTGTTTGASIAATGGSITLSSAQAVLSDVRLVVAGSPCSEETELEDADDMSSDEPDADHDDENETQETQQGTGCEKVQAGPLTINLPLDASTELVLDALVPAGTYSGVHVKLQSLNVSGTFTDAGGAAHPFTFALNGKAVIQIKLPAPITVGPGTSNVTLMVDVASWFKTASGAVLDPTNEANAGAINTNIRRSFRAFADRDRDGEDDDHEEHDDDGAP